MSIQRDDIVISANFIDQVRSVRLRHQVLSFVHRNVARVIRDKSQTNSHCCNFRKFPTGFQERFCNNHAVLFKLHRGSTRPRLQDVLTASCHLWNEATTAALITIVKGTKTFICSFISGKKRPCNWNCFTARAELYKTALDRLRYKPVQHITFVCVRHYDVTLTVRKIHYI